jgi:hypothetical protein
MPHGKTAIKLCILQANEVRDFDKNLTQPEIRVNRIRDNESQLYINICYVFSQFQIFVNVFFFCFSLQKW